MLPTRPLGLGRQADAHEPVLRLELLERLDRVVDEGEAGALAAAVLGAEAEDRHLVLAGLVHLRKLGAQLVLGDAGAVRVQDVDDALLAGQERAGGTSALRMLAFGE